MSDEDKPLAELAHAEKNVNPPVVAQDPPKSVSIEPGTPPDGWVAAEPETGAAARLQAFEDEHLGVDAVRINGQIERGVGSAYSRLSPVRHRHYEALERLVASEQKLAAAHAALIQADVDHDAALIAVDEAENEPDAAPAA